MSMKVLTCLINRFVRSSNYYTKCHENGTKCHENVIYLKRHGLWKKKFFTIFCQICLLLYRKVFILFLRDYQQMKSQTFPHRLAPISIKSGKNSRRTVYKGVLRRAYNPILQICFVAVTDNCIIIKGVKSKIAEVLLTKCHENKTKCHEHVTFLSDNVLMKRYRENEIYINVALVHESRFYIRRFVNGLGREFQGVKHRMTNIHAQCALCEYFYITIQDEK